MWRTSDRLYSVIYFIGVRALLLIRLSLASVRIVSTSMTAMRSFIEASTRQPHTMNTFRRMSPFAVLPMSHSWGLCAVRLLLRRMTALRKEEVCGSWVAKQEELCSSGGEANPPR
jgi:cytochrome c biogenesis protein ResB